MGNYLPFRLPFQTEENTDVEVLGSTLAMTYHFPPKSGQYFANHFVMAGEKFENTNPETFLCGENNDLNYLTNKPIPFPYQNAAPEEPSNTIRSLVHLRRDELKLVRIEQAGIEESDVYQVEFVFDADVSCAVHVLLMASEDLTNGSAKYKSRKPDFCSEPIPFGRGAGQHFKSKFYIKPDEFQPSELNYIPGAPEIPLVIQITVEDEAFLGQSESTFAGIEKLSEGAYAIKFMKQKIMIDGLCFMTQEIYGIENKTAAQKASKSSSFDDDPDEDNAECVICMTHIRDTMMLPCRHLCLCHECAEEIRTKESRCPICRANFYALLQVKGVRRKRKTTQGSTESPEELEEVSIIEALNGDLLSHEDGDGPDTTTTETKPPRRSSSSRSRRSRPRSAKSSRGSRGSNRSIKTEAIVKQSHLVPSAPPATPPLTPAYVEEVGQRKRPQEESGDNDNPQECPEDAARTKALSNIVLDSTEAPLPSSSCTTPTAPDPSLPMPLDPSLPGTPMGSEGTESLQVSLTGSLSSSAASKTMFSTRAQITTPSNVKLDDCLGNSVGGSGGTTGVKEEEEEDDDEDEDGVEVGDTV